MAKKLYKYQYVLERNADDDYTVIICSTDVRFSGESEREVLNRATYQLASELGVQEGQIVFTPKYEK